MLDAALRLSRAGFSVFPLAPLTKIPLKDSRGVYDATRDEAVIREMWGRVPRANIAIATGVPSGVVVIDFDPRNGGYESKREISYQGFVFPRTLTAQTPSGGAHYYYRWIDGAKNSSKILGSGIDILATGRAATACPSVVRTADGSLKEYSWDSEDLGAMAPLPRWIVDRLNPPPPVVWEYQQAPTPEAIAGALKFLAFDGSGPKQGDRNNRLFWVSCRFCEAVKAGVISRRDAESSLLHEAMRVGLGATEALLTIRSGFER